MTKPDIRKGLHASLDMEACGEVLLSIGACEFDPKTGEAVREFYATPSIAAQLAVGLQMDSAAFLWWMRQDDAARRAITEHTQEPLEPALDRFAAWMDPIRTRGWLWAYPTSFDLPLMQRVYHRMDLKAPWCWTRTVDARALWQIAVTIDPALSRVEEEAGIKHHALDDAKQQARWIARYLAGLIYPADEAEEAT